MDTLENLMGVHFLMRVVCVVVEFQIAVKLAPRVRRVLAMLVHHWLPSEPHLRKRKTVMKKRCQPRPHLDPARVLRLTFSRHQQKNKFVSMLNRLVTMTQILPSANMSGENPH